MNRTVRTYAAVALLTALFAATAGAAGLFEFRPVYVDLGILAGDVSVPFSFTLENSGSRAIHIVAVDPSCGCTSVFLPDSTIEAGEAVPLTGFFSSRKMEGEVLKTILVDTDDPERPRNVLVLKAWVQRRLTYAPRGVHFSLAWVGREEVETVLFRPGEGIDFTIEGVAASSSRFRTEVVPGELPGDLVLRIVLLPPESPGDFEDTVTVKTNVTGREEIEIPVTGRILPARNKKETK